MTICDSCTKELNDRHYYNRFDIDGKQGIIHYELCDYCQKQLRIIINNYVIQPKQYKGDPNDHSDIQ